MKTFLGLVQDHCLHMCLTGMQEAVPSSWDARALERQHLQESKETCRLYHTHSVSSAILCGKQLVASPRFARGSSVSSILGSQGLMKQSSMSVSLDKEDNSGRQQASSDNVLFLPLSPSFSFLPPSLSIYSSLPSSLPTLPPPLATLSSSLSPPLLLLPSLSPPSFPLRLAAVIVVDFASL